MAEATTALATGQDRHPHPQRPAVAASLARTAGHVASIKRMIEEGRSCRPDVLIQRAAVHVCPDEAADQAEHVEAAPTVARP